MNLNAAINLRRSRRKYANTPIEQSKATKLKALIHKYNKEPGIRMELVLNDGKAFNGFTKSYGMFSGVNDYIGVIAGKNDPTAAERLGYYGELIVLHATEMGLGTCWVGGTFSRGATPFTIADSETLVCTIVIGLAVTRDSLMEKLIRGMTHRKTKSAEAMYRADAPVPDWFKRGMEAVQKAPSAVNRQPVMFEYKNNAVTAAVEKYEDASYGVDYGIAKLHFEVGAGGGKWEWGNGAGFTRNYA